MDFRGYVMGDQPDDALAIGWRQRRPGVGQTFGETVDPQTTVGIEHDFDDGGVFEKCGDVQPERRAEHGKRCFQATSLSAGAVG